MEQKKGLRDVIAGNTALCLLDEKNRKLYYRGYAIEDLATSRRFEDVAHLLLVGELPVGSTGLEKPDYRLPDTVLHTLWEQNRSAHPMDVLGTLVRVMGNEYPAKDAAADAHHYDMTAARILIDNIGYLVGLMKREAGQEKPLPKGRRCKGLAADILYQMSGREPDDFEARLMDVALVLYAEHEFNASSFAVRIAASAHTDIFSAVVAGIGTLRGSRHGGANEEAMYMMLAIGDPANVRAYLDAYFSKPAARLPGFGHAVYTQGDPRVPIMRPYVQELSRRKGDMRWYEICVALEEYMAERASEKNRGIPANIDLWTAPLYYLMNIPTPLYTPLFAASRIAGWCAHYLEVRHVNKEAIIRPRAQYVGAEPRT
ncbi:MAG: citrate/2-methylcitrate synthase [bacterium]|nr:citrate/2-methylcitrate synthase [bacterium]